MKTPASLLLSMVVAGLSAAAPLIDEPVPELRLDSGKVLKLAQARSYSASTVLVRHVDGAAAVRYEEFPSELRTARSARRPAIDEKARTETPLLAAVSYDFPVPPAVEAEPEVGEERVLAGQLFVSTRDAGDVKLSGIKISVYTKAAYREQAAWYYANPWEASRAHSRNAETLAKAGDSAGAMRQFEAATETAALGWMLVAPAQFSTTTDAEGRFTLKHRVLPPYFVVAHASREVEGENENYRWAVISDLIEDAENLVLFNDNME